MRILTHTVLPEEEGRMVKGILRGSLQLSYTLLKSLKWRESHSLKRTERTRQRDRPRGRCCQCCALRAHAARGSIL